jgi:MFS family permease
MSSMSSTSSTAESAEKPVVPGTLAPVSTPVPVLAYAVTPVNAPKARIPLFSAEAWTPLRVELFRNLYIATSIAQIGTWAREAGSPWLMNLLTERQHNQPAMVAAVLVFSNLPICLFSVFAGALADVLDRRQWLIWTNVWMVIVSTVLGLMTWAGIVTPLSLLAMTFLLGVGTAAMGPALQGMLPELVPAKEMALAINLNSVALNVARAVGPATFIVVVHFIKGKPGVAVSYLWSALSFVGAVWVLSAWKRPPQRAALHGEEMWGAIRFGFRYTIWSRANRAILLRVFTFIVPAVVMWAQMPIIARRQLGLGEEAYALLFAFVGMGAIFGVLLMPGLHKRYSIDPVVNVCTLLYAGGLVVLSFVHVLWLAAIVLVFLGVNWVIIPTNFNTATQKSVPLWVKGRAISFYLTVLFGSFTVAGIVWGRVTTATNIHTSLLASGIAMAALLVLAKWFPLTLNEGMDLSPAFKGAQMEKASHPILALATQAPSETAPAKPGAGATAIAIEYGIDPCREDEFTSLMHQVGHQRRRNGASAWRLDRVSPGNGQIPAAAHVAFTETFHFLSPVEHTRQTARLTKADITLLDKALACHTAPEPPAVHTGPSDLVPLGIRARDGLGETLINSIFRTMEEAERMIERFQAPRNRDPLK